MSTYNIISGRPVVSPVNFLLMATNLSSYQAAYPWLNGSYGTKFSNPSSAMNGIAFGADVSPSGNSLTFGSADSTLGYPRLGVYQWDTINGGYGVAYGGTGTFTNANCQGVNYNKIDSTLACCYASPTSIRTYPTTASGSLGTVYSSYASSPGGNVAGVAFSPTGADISGVGIASPPYIWAYPWTTASGYGTKYSNPTAGPGNTNSLAFSPNTLAIATASSTTPFLVSWRFTSGTGFGTKYSNPATLPTGGGNSVAISPDGTAVAIAHTTTPFISVYPFDTSTGYGTKFANTTGISTDGNAVSFTQDGQYIMVGVTGSPYLYARGWSSSGFGATITSPSTVGSQVNTITTR